MHTVKLSKQFSFEAAHRLPKAPEGHKCRNLHGHSFRFDVEVMGPVDPETAWFMDYKDISSVAKPIADELDHTYLNEIPGLEDGTSEILARWIWKRLEKNIEGLHRITVYETVNSRCDYYGEEL
ncbi:MAG: 6-carboxytetrahydropterin synthase QueD [Deltaproteobacteria bacterium]|nr:6-carboxytetrahydropterin synthase QueD [Deltaproteobacteria bacterium]